MMTLIAVSALIALAVVLLAYKLGQRRASPREKPAGVVASPGLPAALDVQPVPVAPVPDGFQNLELVDSHGSVVMNFEKMPLIPFNAWRLDSSSDEICRLGGLASDLLKAGVSVPGKTIKLIFKPEIAQGLEDGALTLMRTKSGEVLADAVDSTTKQVMGKGRVVQAGSARQLAAGAFQLVSIAVAQAHLADIERSMGKIKDGISELNDRLEASDQSSISGAIAYMSEIAAHMKDANGRIEISSEKSHVIEGINQKAFVWRDKVQRDLVDLTRRVKALTDKDMFGTGDTHKQLLDLVRKGEPLLVRHGLLLHLMAVTNMIVTYLDPAKRIYTRMRPQSEEWVALMQTFGRETTSRADALLAKARFTSDELLDYRRTAIHRLVDERTTEVKLQISEFESLMQKLDGSTRQLMNGTGEACLAFKYDNNGRVEDAAFVQ